MADNLSKRPAKGILKTSSSFEQQESQKLYVHQDIKWDEMNILQTLHPPDKDYGHMKVEEPKTPFSYYTDDVDGDGDGEHPGSDHEGHSLDPDLLSKKISLGKDVPPKAVIEEDMESEEDENETEEDRAKRKAFESKRKSHYNEFYAVKLARKLMEQDIDEDADEDKAGDANVTCIEHDEDDNSQEMQPNLDAKDKPNMTQPKSPRKGFPN